MVSLPVLNTVSPHKSPKDRVVEHPLPLNGLVLAYKIGVALTTYKSSEPILQIGQW